MLAPRCDRGGRAIRAAGLRAGVERVRPRGRRDELDHVDYLDNVDLDGRADDARPDDARANDHDADDLDNEHDLTGGLSCR